MANLSREVRLGLVLYGGVSLAVYENGVAQELFKAAKGAGIYTIIKRLAAAEIVVDIVSGASAGGINGILLGYALAKRFSGFFSPHMSSRKIGQTLVTELFLLPTCPSVAESPGIFGWCLRLHAARPA